MASRTPPSEVLAGWLAGRRWYATKARRIAGLVVEDQLPFGGAVLLITGVTLDDGSYHRYALPLLPTSASGEVADALDDPGFCRALLDLVATGGRVVGERGELRGVPTAALPGEARADLPVRRLGGEQSNTSVAFGRTFIMKQFRRLADGLNPEEEMTRFLTERAGFAGAPRLYGSLEYRGSAGNVCTLAVVQEQIPDCRDGWQWMLEELGRLADAVQRSGGPPDPSRLRTLAGASLSALSRLGGLTAALHRALASDAHDPAFSAETITSADIETWSSQVQAELARARAALGADPLPRSLAMHDGLAGLLGCHKIRIHGDFHLGQTLYREARGEWVIIDFEGEPLRPLVERRAKQAAVRDVAGLLRSLDYAAMMTLARAPGEASAWAAAWRDEAERQFVSAYEAGAQATVFMAASRAAFDRAVAVFELEKAAYEVLYEVNHRPDWVAIPTRGLVSAASRISPGAAAGAA